MRTDQLTAAVAPSEIVFGVAVKLVVVRVRQSITFGSGDPPPPPPIGAAYADATQKLDRMAARINLAPAWRNPMCVLDSLRSPILHTFFSIVCDLRHSRAADGCTGAACGLALTSLLVDSQRFLDGDE